MAVHLTQEEAGFCRTPMRQFLTMSPIQALIHQCPVLDQSASPSRLEDVITIWPVRKLFSSSSREPSTSPTSGYSSDHESSDEFYCEENLQQLHTSWDLMPRVRTLSGSSTESTAALKKIYNRKRKSESSLTWLEQDQQTKKRSRSQSPSERPSLVMKFKQCDYGYKIVSKTSPIKMAVNIKESKIHISPTPVLVPAQQETVKKLSKPVVTVTDCKSYTRTKEDAILEFQEARAVAPKRKHDAKKRDDEHNLHGKKDDKKPKLDEEPKSDCKSKSDQASKYDEKKKEHSKSNLLERVDSKHKSASHTKRNEKDIKRSMHDERTDRKHKSDSKSRHEEKDSRRSKYDSKKREDNHKSVSKSRNDEKDSRRSKHYERKREDDHKSVSKSRHDQKDSRRSNYDSKKREDNHKSASKSSRDEKDTRRSKYDERKREDDHKSGSNSKRDEKRKVDSFFASKK